MPAPTRQESLDVARGFLLVGMLAVHVLSAHGTPQQAGLLHSWIGVFLISSGFVALSGYMLFAKTVAATSGRHARQVASAVRLLLVMLGYGVLLSLLRHGFRLAAGGDEACIASFGWDVPTRFADIGILLPIALVQLLATLVPKRRFTASVAAIVAALAWMLVPAMTQSVPETGVAGAVVGVLARRTITPFFTVATFVAMGFMGVFLALSPLRDVIQKPSRSRLLDAGFLFAAFALAIPKLSQAVLGTIYQHGGVVMGSVAMLAWWTTVLFCFLRGFASSLGSFVLPARATLALLGRNSLFVFVVHDVLLEINLFARAILGAPKGITTVLLMFAVDVLLLLLACKILERRALLFRIAELLLLVRGRSSQPARAWAFSWTAGLVFVALLSVYTASVFSAPERSLVLDDFERDGECPKWWTFGGLSFERDKPPDDRSELGRGMLSVRGQASSTYAQGRGLFLHKEIGSRKTLKLDVRGYGPESGRIKIELGEDDNGNWDIEKDERFRPLFDDRWVRVLEINWWGWREVVVPVATFHDDNPEVGNNVFDAERDLTSGGLMEFQLLFGATPGGNGNVRIDLDNVRWTP